MVGEHATRICQRHVGLPHLACRHRPSESVQERQRPQQLAPTVQVIPLHVSRSLDRGEGTLGTVDGSKRMGQSQELALLVVSILDDRAMASHSVGRGCSCRYVLDDGSITVHDACGTTGGLVNLHHDTCRWRTIVDVNVDFDQRLVDRSVTDLSRCVVFT